MMNRYYLYSNKPNKSGDQGLISIKNQSETCVGTLLASAHISS